MGSKLETLKHVLVSLERSVLRNNDEDQGFSSSELLAHWMDDLQAVAGLSCALQCLAASLTSSH